MRPSGQIVQREVGRVERAQLRGPLGGRRAERDHALGEIHRHGAIEQCREASEVDAVVADEPGMRRRRDAAAVLAETLRLELPAELLRRDAQHVAVERGRDGARGAFLDERDLDPGHRAAQRVLAKVRRGVEPGTACCTIENGGSLPGSRSLSKRPLPATYLRKNGSA